VLEDLLGPLLGRDPDELAAKLPVGTREHCAALLDAYARAGAREVLLWPVRDPVRQLAVVAEDVRPVIS
jgi:hypothetical protein